MSIVCPVGLPAILEAYHAERFNAEGVVIAPPNWEQTWLGYAVLPKPIPTFGGSQATHIRIHKKLVPALELIMNNIYREHPDSYNQLFFSGSFVPRLKRGLSEPSCHALGIAVDWNDSVFPMQRGVRVLESDMPEWYRNVIDAFHKDGWKWGGDFGDKMHFQAAKGY